MEADNVLDNWKVQARKGVLELGILNALSEEAVVWL